mgnify:CR=1 FL=1|jgi:hypothetical protein
MKIKDVSCFQVEDNKVYFVRQYERADSLDRGTVRFCDSKDLWCEACDREHAQKICAALIQAGEKPNDS